MTFHDAHQLLAELDSVGRRIEETRRQILNICDLATSEQDDVAEHDPEKASTEKRESIRDPLTSLRLLLNKTTSA